MASIAPKLFENTLSGEMKPGIGKLNGDRLQVYKLAETQNRILMVSEIQYLASVCITISNMPTYVAGFTPSLLTELGKQGKLIFRVGRQTFTICSNIH